MKINYKLLTIILIILMLNLSNYTVIKAFLYTDTYGYKTATICNSDGSGCVADPWSFWERECVSYAAHKVNESGVAMSNGMQGPNGTTGWFGSAETWDSNASNIGYTVDTSASVGSVAVWEARPGYPYYMDSGHVAWVEQVNTTSIYVSEYNWNFGDHSYNERTPSLTPDHYIHFSGGLSCGANDVIITNRNITSGLTCIGHNSITLNSVTNVTGTNGDVTFKIQ